MMLADRKNDSDESKTQFDQALIEAIECDDFSFLASEISLAKDVDLSLARYGTSLYRDCKLANIEALFRANLYLTSIDRQPMKCETDSEIDAANGPLSVSDFCSCTLKIWYDAHPDYLRFSQGKPCFYALIVTPSVQQFGGIFVALKTKHGTNSSIKHKVCDPYEAINIVTLNSAGTMEIRLLMSKTPLSADAFIARFMLQRNEDFYPTNDSLYPLSYKGRSVLIAHNLHLQHLFDALLDYENSKKFYVACYPEQVKFIRKIMPNAEFL